MMLAIVRKEPLPNYPDGKTVKENALYQYND